MKDKPLIKWGERTYLMGIINVTPDSFSGDGLISDPAGPEQLREAVLAKARQFVKEGVDILDVGGESTRPGSEPVSTGDELARVIPAIEGLVGAELGVVISVDTYKASIAEAALNAGANWVNDVRGLHGDQQMAEIVSRYKVPVVLMHNRMHGFSPTGTPRAEQQTRLGGRYVGTHYANLMEDVKTELLGSVAIAHSAGIADENIILDPGLGFGKTVEQSLELINCLDELRALGYPLLVGPSRKSFIGYTLDLGTDQRVEGTAAAVAISIARGADIVRVHDVGVMWRVARLADAIVRQKPA